MPFMKTFARPYQKPTIEDLQWEVRWLRRRLEKIARRRNISTMVPAHKCLKCHGFGHNASECTTKTLIVFTPDGRVIEVEEKKEPIWDEDSFEELQEPIWDEYQCEELQFPVEEVSWSPSEIESNEVIEDDVPCMIMPPEPSETRLQLLPCEIPQPQELFAASVQPYQTENDVTSEVLLQLHPHELSGDSLEVENIEMILPPDLVKLIVQLLLGHSSRTPLEYKYLPNTVIPKVDLTWVWVKSKKVSVGSIGKLRGKASVITTSQGATTALFVKKTSPPLGENDRGRSLV